MSELQGLFPDAELRLQGETYGDAEDIVVKIFTAAEQTREILRRASELSQEYDLATGYFILPVVIPR
jgi:hypothetical protein